MSDVLFRQKAPAIIQGLMDEFSCTVEDAAAVLGNGGHESGGFKFLQELKPMVAGSRGGYGWFQWTGVRRRAFEKWCSDQNLDPASDAANFGFLCVELRGTERAAIPAVKNADGLRQKVIAFERKFERAGVKHYDSRLRWAEIALDAYYAATTPADPPPVEVPLPAPRPEQAPRQLPDADQVLPPRKTIGKSKTAWSIYGILTPVAGTVGSILSNASTVALICLTVIVCLALFIFRERLKKIVEHGI